MLKLLWRNRMGDSLLLSAMPEWGVKMDFSSFASPSFSLASLLKSLGEVSDIRNILL